MVKITEMTSACSCAASSSILVFILLFYSGVLDVLIRNLSEEFSFETVLADFLKRNSFAKA